MKETSRHHQCYWVSPWSKPEQHPQGFHYSLLHNLLQVSKKSITAVAIEYPASWWRNQRSNGVLIWVRVCSAATSAFCNVDNLWHKSTLLPIVLIGPTKQHESPLDAKPTQQKQLPHILGPYRVLKSWLGLQQCFAASLTPFWICGSGLSYKVKVKFFSCRGAWICPQTW